MNKTWSPIPVFVAVMALLAGCGGGGESGGEGAPAISGRIEAGLRVLTLDPSAAEARFTIYRGDYVRLETTDGSPVTISVPDLAVDHTFPPAEGEKAYFKVPDVGSFPFTAGAVTGVIEALEYRSAAYREVGAADGAALIRNESPVVLDVRTPREFQSGHLENAVLIPVQVLRSEMGRLAGHEDDTVFVYCRTGNRSTVAAKMLVDAGFKHVVNLRHGIREWQQLGLPVVR